MSNVDFYLLRHAATTGQEPGAALTADGLAAADQLVERLSGRGIDAIWSSPYQRAQSTVLPFAKATGLDVNLHDGLVEWRLSDPPLPDWQDHLRAGLADADLAAPGGETARQVEVRGHTAIAEARKTSKRPLLVSHGGWMTILLRGFGPASGGEAHGTLRTPDLFAISSDGWRRADLTGGSP